LRGKVIHVYLTKPLVDLVLEAVKPLGISKSEFIRYAVIEHLIKTGYIKTPQSVRNPRPRGE
jgi:hypothetical protein